MADKEITQFANPDSPLITTYIGSTRVNPVIWEPPTAKDYIQDGLVAMWDGIENVGWGQHDATATTWVDLAGQYDLVRRGITGTWRENGHEFNGTYPFYNTSFPKELNVGPWTVEAVYMLTQSMSNYRALFGSRVSDSYGIYGLNYWSSVGGYSMGTGAPTTTDAITWNKNSSVLSPLVTLNTPHQYSASFRNGDRFILSTQGSEVLSVNWYPAADSNEHWSRTNGYLLGAGYTQPNQTIGANISGRTFVGKIFTHRIYSRILTAAEVAANYAVDKIRFGL